MSEPGATITTNNRAKVLFYIVVLLMVAILIMWAITWVFAPEAPVAHPVASQPVCQDAVQAPAPAELPHTGVSE